MQDGVISLAHMVHSSSGLAASVLGADDRGYIRVGSYADILVFDPAKVVDVADFDEPHAYSEGMDYVLVNGRPAILQGKLAEERYGRVLRPRR
jgi:N-acyl-D-aspartate/D-glutamate deacylase